MFYPTLLELPEDFNAETDYIDLENLKGKPKGGDGEGEAPKKKSGGSGKKTHVGVLRGKGELHITGDNDFEAIDLDKTSVTTFTNLQEKAKKKGGKKTHVGVLRGKGELHITGDNDFEAIDLDKTSVTHFTNLLII